MTTHRSRLGRRLLAAVSAGALAVGVLATVAGPAQAAPDAVPVTTTGSGPSYVDDATFTWGVSGYAQKGIFGPWTFKDATGNVTLLQGSTQTEYTASPVPATSMPPAGGTVPANPNAVKFSSGTGVVDTATGAGKLSWTGSYTVNAYPPQFNAPNEIYQDPILTIAADGSGTLTANFGIGAGVDMQGNPFDAIDYGRLNLANFDAGSLSNKTATGYRATPKYQGVTNGLAGQNTTCTTDSGATGWWGSWPTAFITALNSSSAGQSVLPHFYSTGCGGMQDFKPQLPIDVKYTAEPAPQVTVSNTRVDAEGTTTVTVSGTGFHYPMSIGTRPPLSGQTAGSYITFGKFAEVWRPSLGSTLAPSGNRKTATAGNGGLKWAVPAANMVGIGGANAGAIELTPSGTFTTDLVINKAALDASAGAGTEAFRYGIYTYGGSGAVAPAYETYTPITFLPVASTVALDKASYAGTAGATTPVVVTVSGANEPEKATGAVTLSITPEGGSATQVDTGTLANGTATLDLPADLDGGTAGALSVSYEGDEIYAAGTKTATYSVAENPATVSLDKASYTGTVGSAVPVAITVGGVAGKPTPTGSVVLTYTPAGGAATPLPAADLVAGEAVVSLPGSLGVGSGSISVAYSGDDLYGPDAETATYAIAKNASVVSITGGPSSVAYRTAATYTATVSAGTGNVVVKVAGKNVNAPIVGGKATFKLPATLPAGPLTLTFSYAGDASTSAATPVNKKVTIAPGASAVAAKVTSKWTAKKAGKLTVTVRSVKGGPVPTGKVKLVLKKGKVTRTVAAKVLRNGKVVLALPKAAKGTWSVRATYLGSTQHKTVTRAWTVKVPAK
ncbi:hypothetical protein EFK50_14870 [Nocardioides marmoriginsengisoli]|uniref:Ig-like domain repeat protein n=1 Tax=Nocardioides marmoriginsengisoli TaxID=661483 RepID=A0A3N0CJ08_9ACTN|nr:Ig-like domain repeat protein [Nocardioides marmoriginsengisoli]RNL62996.1 hypothetical protein EFK50_14870 [Nocardioides marmoriginsengisoli]